MCESVEVWGCHGYVPAVTASTLDAQVDTTVYGEIFEHPANVVDIVKMVAPDVARIYRPGVEHGCDYFSKLHLYLYLSMD